METKTEIPKPWWSDAFEAYYKTCVVAPNRTRNGHFKRQLRLAFVAGIALANKAHADAHV